MAIDAHPNIALWVVTPNGLKLAQRLQGRWPNADLRCGKKLGPGKLSSPANLNAISYDRFTHAVADHFYRYDGHIFIMATGIVVRTIAPLLKHKTVDPAVVVVDDGGRFAISLTSGHLGGANLLAEQAAIQLGATPVITTATDVNSKPAIDLLAQQHDLKIENPSCIKAVNMALLTDVPIRLHDPEGRLERYLPGTVEFSSTPSSNKDAPTAGVWVDDTVCDLGPETLILRPPSLVAGIGCNRDTVQEEIRDLLLSTLEKYSLSPNSLSAIASIDLKSDEKGILSLAEDMNLSLRFYDREELALIGNVPTPSTMVAKHVGVPSVCEAAAILASQKGQLIVPKHNTRNVTVAIARMVSISSVPAPVT